MNRIIIDVREPEEFALGHVEGAINVPPAKLLGDIEELKDIPKKTRIILYCRTGNRSNVAMQILQTKGYINLVNGINQDHVEAKYL